MVRFEWNERKIIIATLLRNFIPTLTTTNFYQKGYVINEVSSSLEFKHSGHSCIGLITFDKLNHLIKILSISKNV